MTAIRSGLIIALLTFTALSARTLHADAKANYDKLCAKCHGADGRGQTKMGKQSGAKDYTDPKVQEALTDDASYKAIKEGFKVKGKEVMKPAEGLSDADIKGLVAHMRTFKK